MLFFKKKAKVSLKEFCSEYYVKYFLEPIGAGIEMGSSSYVELIFEQIKEVDAGFSKVDFDKLFYNMLLIRFELFSLAWFHQFGDKASINQSIFTKEYLIESDKEDVWNNAVPYNQAIAQSALHGATSSTAVGRARIAFVNTMRVELFKKYMGQGLDNECIARALNRIGTDANWKSLSITLEYLERALEKNISYQLNSEAGFRLIAILKGFYDGVKQNLEQIKITDSY